MSDDRPIGDDASHDDSNPSTPGPPVPVEPAADAGDTGTAPVSVTVVRVAAAALALMGVLTIVLSGRLLLDVDGVRCRYSRELIENANDDDEAFNDVVLPEGGEVDELSCEDAIALAERIPEDEQGDDTESVPSEGRFRFEAGVLLIVGLGQAISGFFTIRTYARTIRTAALVFAGLGFLYPVLGLLSMAVSAFVLYALGFSAASRQIWGRRGGPPRPSLFGFGRR